MRLQFSLPVSDWFTFSSAVPPSQRQGKRCLGVLTTHSPSSRSSCVHSGDCPWQSPPYGGRVRCLDIRLFFLQCHGAERPHGRRWPSLPRPANQIASTRHVMWPHPPLCQLWKVHVHLHVNSSFWKSSLVID